MKIKKNGRLQLVDSSNVIILKYIFFQLGFFLCTIKNEMKMRNFSIGNKYDTEKATKYCLNF